MWTSAPPSSSAVTSSPGRRLHQRRAAEKNRPGSLDDDRFVGHCRHVGAAGGARPHDHRNLRDAFGRHPRLVEEDAAEVLPVRKDLRLQREERATGIDQVEAGQAVVERDLLRAQMLLHGDRIVGAALDGGVVGDDDHLASGDAADAGDQAGAGSVALVHVPGGERRQLQERRAGIEQPVDSLARPAACPARDAAGGSARRRPAGPGRAGCEARRCSPVIRSRLVEEFRAVRADAGCPACPCEIDWDYRASGLLPRQYGIITVCPLPYQRRHRCIDYERLW